MVDEKHFDSVWPVALLCALLAIFTLALTPAGEKVQNKFVAWLALRPKPSDSRLSRLDVLVVACKQEDEERISLTVVPRGYRVRRAQTAKAAEAVLRGSANQIGIVVLDAGSRDATVLAVIVPRLAPAARMVPIPAHHDATDVAELLLAVI